MLGILSYLTSGFDLRPTLIAGFVCIHASFTAIILFQRAAAAQGSGRIVWIATCGVTTGLGIWATHFVGTLAFAPSRRRHTRCLADPIIPRDGGYPDGRRRRIRDLRSGTLERTTGGRDHWQRDRVG